MKEYKKIRLSGHESAACYAVRDNDDNIALVSYATTVIRIVKDAGVRMVECTGTYSATTRKHIGWFLREYASDLSYYDMKNIAGSGLVQM